MHVNLSIGSLLVLLVNGIVYDVCAEMEVSSQHFITNGPTNEGKHSKKQTREAEEMEQRKKEEDKDVSGAGGYLPHAYDYDAAKRLWNVSNELVGLPLESEKPSAL